MCLVINKKVKLWWGLVFNSCCTHYFVLLLILLQVLLQSITWSKTLQLKIHFMLVTLIVMWRARLGLKAGAWARLFRAQASPKVKPGPQIRLGLGPGRLRLGPGLASKWYNSLNYNWLLILLIQTMLCLVKAVNLSRIWLFNRLIEFEVNKMSPVRRTTQTKASQCPCRRRHVSTGHPKK